VTVHGTLRVEASVADAYADLVAAAFAKRPRGQFVLGCSGSGSGKAAIQALVAHGGVDWSKVVVVFADERCVAPDSPDANESTVREALGPLVAELAGFHPMRCSDGADAYNALLTSLGHIDVLQLGMGPDGHTASLFPGATGDGAPAGRFVITNSDPSGRNVYERLSLTYAGIALADLVLVTVIGAEKRAALESVISSDELPAARLSAKEIIFLVDPAALPADD
jgi:6-phosphogluconolactonase